jgi:uncharacterized protein
VHRTFIQILLMRKKSVLISLVIIASLIVFAIFWYAKTKKGNLVQTISNQKTKTYTSKICGKILPSPTGYTNDYMHLFTEGEKWQLDSLIGEHEKQTSNQITIITIDSTMLGSCTLKDYATEVGNQWGVGQKSKNNGSVFAISLAPRKVFIANGYGIEKIMSNTQTQVIIDSFIIPNFKQGKMFEGTLLGLQKIMQKITPASTSQ